MVHRHTETQQTNSACARIAGRCQSKFKKPSIERARNRWQDIQSEDTHGSAQLKELDDIEWYFGLAPEYRIAPMLDSMEYAAKRCWDNLWPGSQWEGPCQCYPNACVMLNEKAPITQWFLPRLPWFCDDTDGKPLVMSSSHCETPKPCVDGLAMSEPCETPKAVADESERMSCPRSKSFKMFHSSLEYTHGTKGSVCDCCFCGVLQRANSKILSDVLQGKIETHSMSESDKESRRCHGLLNYWANCERIGVKCGPGAIWRVGEDSKISWAVDPPFVPFNIEYDSIANLQSVCNGYNDDKFRWPSPPKLSRRQYRLHRKTHGIVKPRAAAKPPRTMAFVVFKTEVGA